MNTTSLDLINKLKGAGLPVVGVAVGRVSDKATWRVDFMESATDADRTAANAIVAAFDINAPTVPPSVKMWQAKAALAAVGKLDPADAVIAGANNQALSIAWKYATDVSRDSQGMNAVATALGMSSADVDALFIAADAIQV